MIINSTYLDNLFYSDVTFFFYTHSLEPKSFWEAKKTKFLIKNFTLYKNTFELSDNHVSAVISFNENYEKTRSDA